MVGKMIKILASLRGYRTLLAQGVSIVVAALAAFGLIPVAEVAGLTPEKVGADFDQVAGSMDAVVASVMTIGAIINTYLRFGTKGPVGAK